MISGDTFLSSTTSSNLIYLFSLTHALNNDFYYEITISWSSKHKVSFVFYACLHSVQPWLSNWIDKKNENKEVAVNDFLPAEDAIKAIQYSMWVYYEPALLFAVWSEHIVTFRSAEVLFMDITGICTRPTLLRAWGSELLLLQLLSVTATIVVLTGKLDLMFVICCNF